MSDQDEEIFDPEVISPPMDTSKYLRVLPVPDVLPSCPVELDILRLRLLHPDLHVPPSSEQVSQLDEDSKRTLLADMRKTLGVIVKG